MRTEQIVDWVDEQSWLDSIGKPLQNTIHGLFAASGKPGYKLMDFLHGVWLGHPLHAALTGVPIGAWAATTVLDTLEMATGSQAIDKGADAAVALGIAGAVGSAVTGVTDWHHTTGRTRRVGMAHGLLNTTALGLYIASFVARKCNNRRAGWGLALLGFGIISASAFLGGDMVYEQKMGVDHAPHMGLPDKLIAVMPETDLPSGKLVRALVNDTPIVLLRRGGRIYALADTCSHLGGPLSEGELKDDDSVVCPWHGSRFCMEDGVNIHGPSTYDQPAFDARVHDGIIEVKAKLPVH